MKLRNKKTGEIVECLAKISFVEKSYNGLSAGKCRCFDSIDLLNEEWEDAPEEPKDFWYIDDFMIMCGQEGEFTTPDLGSFTKKDIEKLKSIGNYFETKEEAEKAVEKLRAWKRLKDGGITFKNWTINQTGTIDCFATWGDNIPPSRKNPTLLEDLDLLFGGGE